MAQKFRGLVHRLGEELRKRWPEILLRDVVIAVIIGGLLFGASYWSDERRANEAEQLEEARATQAEQLEDARADQADLLAEARAAQAERLENLRFLRDVAARAAGPMPFRNLDLETMDLDGLAFPCRDKTILEACHLKADFTNAHLAQARMSLMDLRGADFTNADLRQTDLSGSNLSGAILLVESMEGAVLDDVCHSGTTIWPDEIEPPLPVCPTPGL